MIHRNVIPSYVTDVIRTNKRRFISRSPVFAVQDQYDSTYDAYDVDIGENATHTLKVDHLHWSYCPCSTKPSRWPCNILRSITSNLYVNSTETGVAATSHYCCTLNNDFEAFYFETMSSLITIILYIVIKFDFFFKALL